VAAVHRCVSGLHHRRPTHLLALRIPGVLHVLHGERGGLPVTASNLDGSTPMWIAIPLVVAILIFPVSLLAGRLRTHRYGYAIPLGFAGLLLSATLISGDPPLPTLFFVVVALGIAWRWWSAHRASDGV